MQLSPLIEYLREHDSPSEVQALATAMLTGTKTLNSVYYGHARQRDAYEKVSHTYLKLEGMKKTVSGVLLHRRQG